MYELFLLLVIAFSIVSEKFRQVQVLIFITMSILYFSYDGLQVVPVMVYRGVIFFCMFLSSVTYLWSIRES